MHQLDVDGLTVLWADAPGPFTATLVLAVGRRDETLVTGDITHLVEHLALAPLGRRPFETNGHVELAFTSFTATGPRDDVLEHLRRVGVSLGSLAVERLPVEVSVLRTESGSVTTPHVSRALGHRYGARGLGLAAFSEPALETLDGATVLAWARRYFVRENAVLWLSGPPPAGFDIPLPHGTRNVRAPVERVVAPYPAVSDCGEAGATVSLECEESEALLAGLRIALARVYEDLRLTRGIVYSPDLDFVWLEGTRFLAVLHADARPTRTAEAAAELVRVLRALASGGPTPEELATDLAAIRTALADERFVLGELEGVARDVLAGVEPRSARERLTELERVTPADVRAALTAALGTLLLVVPEGVDAEAAGLPVDDGRRGQVVTGRVHRRRWRSDAPKGSRLVVGDAGLTMELAGETRTVRYADVVAADVVNDGLVVLLGADGTTVPLERSDWRMDPATFARVLASVPADVRFTSVDVDELAPPGDRRAPTPSPEPAGVGQR